MGFAYKDDPDTIFPVIRYIAAEITANCSDPHTAHMRGVVSKWNALDMPARAFAPPLSKDYAEALALFAVLVRPNGPWDYRPQIGRRFGQWQKYRKYEYLYAIWSGIHYGYISAFIGFGEAMPRGEAGPARMRTREFDDPMHQLSIRMGVSLCRAFPKPASASLSHCILLDVIGANWRDSHKRAYTPYRASANPARGLPSPCLYPWIARPI